MFPLNTVDIGNTCLDFVFQPSGWMCVQENTWSTTQKVFFVCDLWKGIHSCLKVICRKFVSNVCLGSRICMISIPSFLFQGFDNNVFQRKRFLALKVKGNWNIRDWICSAPPVYLHLLPALIFILNKGKSWMCCVWTHRIDSIAQFCSLESDVSLYVCYLTGLQIKLGLCVSLENESVNCLAYYQSDKMTTEEFIP